MFGPGQPFDMLDASAFVKLSKYGGAYISYYNCVDLASERKIFLSPRNMMKLVSLYNKQVECRIERQELPLQKLG